jgi:hypothetical protein
MDLASHASAIGIRTDVMKLDPLAEAATVLAGAFKEADALFDIAAVHDPNLATAHAQRLRDALLLVMLVLGEARRAGRKTASARPARN